MLARSRSLSNHPWLRDLIALALLAGLALAACGFLLRDDLFIYGDHPGQFMRFWYPVRVSRQLLGWNPLWYAGYPELQFYPPGFVLLGWGLDWLTLGQLSPFALYGLLLFVAYLLPGATVYVLVSRVSGRWWVGLLTGGLALIFPGLWGGATAVFVGLVAERLAFGLVPFVLFAGWQALHAQRPGRWWLVTSLTLAAVVLMHPFHTVAPILFLGLAALFDRRRWILLRDLALSSALAVALLAFWLLPLALHRGYAAPMLRADLDQTLHGLFNRNVWSYLAASLLVSLALWVRRDRSFKIFVVSTLGMAAVLVAFILFDHLVLIDRLGLYLLDPVRFSAEYYLAAVLLAGLGLGYLPIWLLRQRRGTAGGLLGGLLVVLALIWLARPFVDLVRSQRNPAHFLHEARQHYPLDEAWEVLRSSQGRVLFTSSYLHLEEVPTALKAATPYFTGREILGGTFSHWSPVARFLWLGMTDVEVLPAQVELTDDVSLAGRPWDDWTDADFLELSRRFNVTTVATTWADIHARTFLDAAPHFQSFYSDDLFVLYKVLDPEPAPIKASGAAATLLESTANVLHVQVAEATPGSSLQAGITDYPLWQVQAKGQQLTHRDDELGLMQVSLVPGSYDLTLRYLPGPTERAGAWISLVAVAVWLAAWVYTFR